MASRLDPEDLRGVLAPFFDAMTEEIHRYGGTVEKFIGDAVVAVFGVPTAHEDDPARAVRAALAMQRRLGALNVELAGQAGGDLSMRIGVDTGEVFAHGSGGTEGLVTGDTMNVAARFQSLAGPGEVIVGERTWRDTRAVFSFQPLGAVNVRGVDQPMPAWRVRSENEVPSTVVAPSTFVGRAQEMELLHLLAARAAGDGRANLVTISGPPGMGKSRLAHEFSRAAEASGVRVVRGRCLPYGEGLTYWPLAEILKGDAGILDSDPPDVMLEKARKTITFGEEGAALGTTSVLLSSIGVAVPSDPLTGVEPGAAARIIARAWQRYAESMAADGPVLALIEDIHWADPSLLTLLESLVDRVAAPVLFLCMTRTELFERRAGWGGGAHATSVSLSPLSDEDGAALVRSLLDGGPPQGLVEPVLARAEGNPFFAGELVRMMIDDGTLERGENWTLTRPVPSELPDTVQGVIASRLDLLAPMEKRAIQDAAAIGRVCWQGAIATLSGASTGEAIEGLIEKGLLHERGASSIAGERELIFHHILTRDVAYASLPRSRRGEVHAVIGSWIEERTAGRSEEFAEILAYHSELAGDLGRTARYATLAGDRHRRVWNAEEAIRWYDRAIAAATDDAALEGEAALARGMALEQIGRTEEAHAGYERAVDRARVAAEANLEARALASLAHVLWIMDRYEEGDRLLPEALDAARAVGAGDLEARLLYTAGTIAFGRGTFRESLPLQEGSLRVAEAAGDREGMALAHHGLCEAYFFVGPFTTGLDHALRADRILRELGQRPMVSHNAYMIGWFRWFLGDWDAAKDAVDASIDGSLEIGNRRDEAFALIARAEILIAAGDVAIALDDADRSVSLAREVGAPRGEMIGMNARSSVFAETWAFDALASSAGEALRIGDELDSVMFRPLALSLTGWLDLRAGDRGRALERFAEADRLGGDALLEIGWSGRVQVQAWEEAGDAEGLERAGSRVEGALLTAGPTLGVWGTTARAIAALLRREHEVALRLAGQALQVSGRVRIRRTAWRAGRVAWLASAALGRNEEAERYRGVARSELEAQVAATPQDLLPTFIARPDVTELLAD